MSERKRVIYPPCSQERHCHYCQWSDDKPWRQPCEPATYKVAFSCRQGHSVEVLIVCEPCAEFSVKHGPLCEDCFALNILSSKGNPAGKKFLEAIRLK